jgi:two-component sensor histidine kinase
LGARTETTDKADAPNPPFPIGGGELGELVRNFDWSQTSLGQISGWPPALRTATNIVLQTPLPMVMLWGQDGVMIYNDAYSVFAGQRHPRLLGSKVLEGWAEVADFNARVLEICLAGGTLSLVDQELILHRNDAPEQVWMNLNYGPVLGDDSRPAGVLAIVVETSAKVKAEEDRRKAEEHLRLVINELNHRVKNTLAMIQAIGAQTFRNADDLEQAQDKFTGRIMALARANDLLTGEKWIGASLRGVIEMTLEGYAADGADRLHISGPHVRLSSKTALSLSMALHELATNANKYGAASTDEGRISVTWNVGVDSTGERLHLEWRETGGPPVSPPTKRGFGSRLIERGLAAELGGKAGLVFEPSGLICVLDASLAPYDDDAA